MYTITQPQSFPLGTACLTLHSSDQDYTAEFTKETTNKTFKNHDGNTKESLCSEQTINSKSTETKRCIFLIAQNNCVSTYTYTKLHMQLESMICMLPCNHETHTFIIDVCLPPGITKVSF